MFTDFAPSAAPFDQAKLIEQHQPLAHSLARRFANRGEHMDDLRQVALLALVKASRRFDPEREVPFAVYATTSIMGELKRHFRDRAWTLHVPRSIQELYLRVKQANEQLTQELGRSPTVAQVADFLKVSEDHVLEAMDAGHSFWPASLDAPARDDDDSPAFEFGGLDVGYDKVLDRARLGELLAGLSDREKRIIDMYYFKSHTQADIGRELGVSQMQVSRLLARVLSKLQSGWVEN